MNRRKHLVLCVALILIAGSALAQATGNIFGTVVDVDGGVLPGVTVTLTGPAATQVFVTDAEGDFRFLSLSPGAYTVNATLEGYGSMIRDDVVVNIGRNTNLTMELNPAFEEIITVTGETPLLDVRRTGTGATITQLELEEVPTARDPWVILQQVPGVLVDRINVGGNQSGQQSGFVSKGSPDTDATFNVDGVNTTDMVATGASPDYFDFGAFEEIQITTGGTDPRVKTPGAQVNMVTKRGTNELEGSARYYLADGDWQSDPEIPEEARDYLTAVNTILENEEVGAEVGGPVVRDKLWLWGAYAEQNVDIIPAQRVGDFVDATTLETINAKLNAQVTANNSLTGVWYRNDKIKLGRNLSPTRPVDAAWNQSDFGPNDTWKIEDTHIFSPNFFVTGLYSQVNGGFQLIATGDELCQTPACAMGQSEQAKFDLIEGLWKDGYLSATIERPQEEVRADASTFFDLGEMNHELRYGIGYRTADVDTNLFWSGPGSETGGGFQTNLGDLYYALGYTEQELGFDPRGILGQRVTAYAPDQYGYEYLDVYVGDTILWNDFTIQLGLRFDSQTGELSPVQAPAVAGFESVLPGLTITNLPEMPEWETLSPRLGITYALGEENRTLLRGAYNRYVTQLGSASTNADQLLPFAYRWIYNYGRDLNGNGFIEADEVLQDGAPECAVFACGDAPFFSGFDINDPTNTGIPEVRLDPGVDAPTTDEFLLGVEHELMPNFVIGGTYTHREFNDFLQFAFEKTPGSGDFYTQADYEFVRNIDVSDVTCPDAEPNCTAGITDVVGNYSLPLYQLRQDVVDQFGNPTYQVMRNRPDYSQTYDGIELTATKRMSNRWMLRGALTLMDWSQDVGPNAFQDPTPSRTDLSGAFGAGCAGGAEFCDGQAVVASAGTGSGPFAGVWVGSDWSYNLTGVYEIPVVEANLGFNLTGREGYPILYNHEVSTNTGFVDVLIVDVDQIRHEDLHQLDLRLSKDFTFQGVGLQVSADLFNVLDEQIVLQRDPELVDRAGGIRIAAARGNNITEIQSARIWRLGARITF